MTWWKKVNARIKETERRRVGRKRYWRIFLVTFPIMFLALHFDQFTEGKEQILLVEVGLFFVFFPTIIFYGVTAMQRCNDIGINRTWLMLMLFPYMKIVIPIILGILKEDSLVDLFDKRKN